MKVIIADGSAVVRAIIEQELKNFPEIKVTASVSNGKKIIQAVENERPDALISGCDINDSVEKENLDFISSKLRLPVFLLADSSVPCPNFLGVTEIIKKPELNAYTNDFISSLVEKLKKIPEDDSSDADLNSESVGFKVLCIGASTGGPSAVSQVLSGLGENFPLPILYVQHLEVGADENMAKWFSSVCHNLRIKLAQDGEEAKPGTVYMAPADRHLVIDFVDSDGRTFLKLSDEKPERFLRPAVNKLFRSAAKFYKKNCLAVLLTGMGADGAEGCREICGKGGWTIAEDKSTCAVFGMPAAAIEMGGAKDVLPRGEIAKRILELVGK